ncbi:sensor histidine kinase [Chthonobacter rhizosphaerae]|uniref:sensor histidine kinase n=1 Tax=Chthonobacter rhizosphaerae TaxID=2735553 RepID=UPI0015EF338C|nr:histidine kinase dimerization/phosphoacceptor domain -containing protein [Chthonobacter rhizosphaerae]
MTHRLRFGQRPGSASRLMALACPLLAVLAATLARQAADPFLPPGFPFLTYFPAVIITAFVFGLGPGVLTAALSTWSAWFFFMPHSGQPISATLIALGFFVAVASVDIVIIHTMQLAQARLKEEQDRSARLAAENATLLKEAQHRISNNLQMLSAILRLQQGQVEHEGARQALRDAASRVNLVGKIQRELYGDATRDTATFLADLARDTVDASGAGSVSLSIRVEPVVLPPEQVTPLGLVMLELLSNAIEHGGADRPLNVAIELRRDDPMVVLTVVDDGVGLPPGFDLKTTRSLGLRIISAMAAQLGGTFELDGAAGTRGRFVFPATTLADPAGRPLPLRPGAAPDVSPARAD